MVYSGKHVTFCENSPEKSLTPTKFQEPDNMISVELNDVSNSVKYGK